MPCESSDSVSKRYNDANHQDITCDIYDPVSNSNTCTEKITSASAAAASTIACTAQSAKNVTDQHLSMGRLLELVVEQISKC